MTATFTDAIADAMLDVVATAGIFVSLHSGDPGSTGADELVGDGYARQAIALVAGADQDISNDDVIVFGPASANWTEATHFGLWTAVSAGTFVSGAELNAAVTVLDTGEATFALGALILALKAIA